MIILALSPLAKTFATIVGWILVILVFAIAVCALLAALGSVAGLFIPDEFRRKAEADEERKRINRILDSLSDKNGNISIGIQFIHEKEASSTSQSTLPDDVSHSRYSSASQTGPAAPQPSSSWPPA